MPTKTPSISPGSRPASAMAVPATRPIRPSTSSSSLPNGVWAQPTMAASVMAVLRSDALVQHADKGEQPACGLVVDLGFVLEPGAQEGGPLVVQSAPAHVDRLDPFCPAFFHGEHVAVHQKLVVLDQAPERAEREDDGGQRRVLRVAHVEDEAAL